jgi:hypothetical protein
MQKVEGSSPFSRFRDVPGSNPERDRVGVASRCHDQEGAMSTRVVLPEAASRASKR